MMDGSTQFVPYFLQKKKKEKRGKKKKEKKEKGERRNVCRFTHKLSYSQMETNTSPQFYLVFQETFAQSPLY